MGLVDFRIGPLPPPDPEAILERLQSRLKERYMPVVRAKFKVTKIERTMGSRPKKDADGKTIKNDRGYDENEPCEMNTIHMQPVYGNNDPNHENTKFWQSSPGGSFQMNCVNAAAVAAFVLDKEYYLDFTPAD